MGPQDLVFFVFVGLMVWLLLIRPQRARAKALQEIRAALQVEPELGRQRGAARAGHEEDPVQQQQDAEQDGEVAADVERAARGAGSCHGERSPFLGRHP